MKVFICGKGGSGKSTLSALIAVALKNQGYRVLLIDADESNFSLHRMMGVAHPVSLMDSLGGKKGFRAKIAPAFPQKSEEIPFTDRVRINEIPEACIAKTDGIRLLVIGKIHHFGEGCACPMGALSKLILSKLDITENEVVIIDTAAGVEHFGRGIDADGDLILAVIDPTYESFELAKKMYDMATNAAVDMFFVLNKVDEKIRGVMVDKVKPEKVIAAIPYTQAVFMDNLEGKKLETSLHEIDPVCQFIQNLKKGIRT
jgi:CO dehydrogenase maturation factor